MRTKQKHFIVLSMLAVLLCSIFAPFVSAETKEGAPTKSAETLHFHEDGSFKIMQMSDFQDYISKEKPQVNPRSLELMRKALEQEQPDLVVMTGDQIGGNMDAEQLQDYITQMVAPLEEAKVPWLVTFGNHDEDATDALKDGWNKIKQLEFYRSFSYNVNEPSMSGAEGLEENGLNSFAVGDMYALIYDSEGKKPIYNIWALDSNRYSSSPSSYYDWIHQEQIDWYRSSSEQLEAEYGFLNSLMFFHIPLPEFKELSANALFYGATGHRFEDECPADFNSGLFLTALERGDVRGIFVGHDHVNDYVGNYEGIILGYDANVGFETYGLGGEQNHAMRGVRVFELDAQKLDSFETRMVYASDLGIDTSVKEKLPAAHRADTFELTILHDNDIHGVLNRLPYFKTLIDEVRETTENVLVLNGGDIFLRGAQEAEQGIPEMTLMNAIGYDAWVLGNNDFRVPIPGAGSKEGNEQLQNLIEKADMPTLCANVRMREDDSYIDKVEPYVIKEMSGLKVAIIGITSLKPQNRGWKENSDKEFIDPATCLETLLQELAGLSDINIVLSHAGLRDDISMSKLPGVAAVIGADDHYILREPIYSPGPMGYKSPPIVQAGGEHDQYLGRLDLSFELSEGEWTVSDFSGFLYSLEGVAEDKELADMVEELSAEQKSEPAYCPAA